MIKRDKKKTEELLKGLGGEVKVIDIDKFLQKQGLLVDVHVHKPCIGRTIPPSAFGIDVDKSAELSDFFKDYIKSGRISFIDAKHAGVFSAVETSIRAKKKELATGFGNKYMNIEAYKEFKKFLEAKTERFNQNVAQIVESWETLTTQFANALDKSLDEMGAIDKEEIKNLMLSKIPSKEKFQESCGIDIDISTFPVVENLSLLDDSLTDDMKEKIERQSLNTVYEILGTILGDVFNTNNKILKFHQENGDLNKPHIDAIAKALKRVKSRNVLKNPVIDRMAKNMEKIATMSDVSDIIEVIEEIQTLIYAFAKDIQVETYLDLDNSPISESSFELLAKGYEL